jgi:hypothetical protein
MSSTDGWCLGQDLNLETPKYDKMLLRSPALNLTTITNQTLFTIFLNCSCSSTSVQFICKRVSALSCICLCAVSVKLFLFTPWKHMEEEIKVLRPLILNLATKLKWVASPLNRNRGMPQRKFRYSGSSSSQDMNPRLSNP